MKIPAISNLFDQILRGTSRERRQPPSEANARMAENSPGPNRGSIWAPLARYWRSPKEMNAIRYENDVQKSIRKRLRRLDTNGRESYDE